MIKSFTCEKTVLFKSRLNAGEVPVNRLVGVKEENFKSKIYINISLLLSQRIMHTVVHCNYYTLIQQSIVHIIIS